MMSNSPLKLTIFLQFYLVSNEYFRPQLHCNGLLSLIDYGYDMEQHLWCNGIEISWDKHCSQSSHITQCKIGCKLLLFHFCSRRWCACNNISSAGSLSLAQTSSCTQCPIYGKPFGTCGVDDVSHSKSP